MIKENIRNILNKIPKNIEVIAAVKKRNIDEILEAIDAGIKIIGENYVHEAESKYPRINKKVQWHFIGHLQKNKVKRALKIFDVIETLDSLPLAETLNDECQKINKILPVMIEVNIAREPQKNGIFPENLEDFVKKIIQFPNIKLVGIMTMGSSEENAESTREQFKKTKKLFDRIKETHPKIKLAYLSMGMSSSYKIAIKEGANIIRLGTILFNPKR
jgi:hypothetical protein